MFSLVNIAVISLHLLYSRFLLWGLKGAAAEMLPAQDNEIRIVATRDLGVRR